MVTVIGGDGHPSGNSVSRGAEKGTEHRQCLWHVDWLSTRMI